MRNGTTPVLTPQQKFEADLNSTVDNGTITLTGNITMADLDLTKLVNLNLAGFTITGNVTINTTTTGTLNISAGTITGNLTVDTPNATVNNSSTVNGTITITDVSNATWNENGNENTLVFQAAGKTLNIGNDAKVKNLILDAVDAKIIISKGASFINSLAIKQRAIIISEQAVTTKVEDGIEVILKATATDEGITVTGTGEEATPIDPKEISDILKKIHSGIFYDIPYPGDKEDYSLTSFISEKIIDFIGTNESIKLNSVSNESMNSNYYKVILNIDGVTVSKEIRVDTLTVGTEKALNDAMGYNVTTIYLANDIIVQNQIIVIKRDLMIYGNGHEISAATDMTYTHPNKSIFTVLADGVLIMDLTVDASKVNETGWNGVYALQVYDSIGVFLDKITLKNADAALYVNGSEIRVKNITIESNEFGGIEVSKGALAERDPELTVTGNIIYNNNADNTPVIWIDGKTTNDGWVNVYGYFEVEKDGQLWFIEK